ncbi:Sialate O-acetylesterase domain [Sesbania bispinosa]|nr:Sialate O-acetylesterase domain [Sesbania bispinosa]
MEMALQISGLILGSLWTSIPDEVRTLVQFQSPNLCDGVQDTHVWCGADTEDILHCLRDCEKAHMVWLHLGLNHVDTASQRFVTDWIMEGIQLAGEPKNMPSLLLLLFLIQTWPTRLQADRNIFILAGQSNMAGRGGVVNDTATGVTTWDGVVPPQCRPNPSIERLDAKLRWVEAHEPLHKDIDAEKTNGIGPGMAFANSILHKHKVLGIVGLVPCAIGGTNISQWERGKELYNHMMKRIKASLRDGGTIRALLWYQGESDTENLNDAQSYQTRVHKFFLDVRDDMQSPLLPIIQVALASGSGPYIEIVRQAQLGIDLLNLKTVDAKGLALEPDGLHLSTPAQVDLGQMMANAFLQCLLAHLTHPHALEARCQLVGAVDDESQAMQGNTESGRQKSVKEKPRTELCGGAVLRIWD